MNALGISHVDIEASQGLRWQSDGESQPSTKEGALRWQSDGESQPSIKVEGFHQIAQTNSKTDYTTEGSTSIDDEDILRGEEGFSSGMDTPTDSVVSLSEESHQSESEIDCDSSSEQQQHVVIDCDSSSEQQQHVLLDDDESEEDLSIIFMAKKYLGQLHQDAKDSKSHFIDEEQCGGLVPVKNTSVVLDENDPPSVGDPSVNGDDIASKSKNQILPLTLENVDYIASMEEATHSNSLSTMQHKIPDHIARSVFTKTIPCEIARDMAEDVSTLYAPSVIFDEASTANKSKKSFTERSLATARADNLTPIESKAVGESLSLSAAQYLCGDRGGLEIVFIILMISSALTLLALVIYIFAIE